MQVWFQFYSVIGGAAAALMGLLFVAVSLNARAILAPEHEHLKRFAEQAFQNFITVLMVSLFAIFPSLTIPDLGFALIGVTALSSVWVLIRLYMVLARPAAAGARLRPLRRQFSSLVGFALLVFAATRMVFDLGDSRTSLAIATIVLLFSATEVSWELLLAIGKANA